MTEEWKKIAARYNRCQGCERTKNTGGEEAAEEEVDGEEEE